VSNQPKIPLEVQRRLVALAQEHIDDIQGDGQAFWKEITPLLKARGISPKDDGPEVKAAWDRATPIEGYIATLRLVGIHAQEDAHADRDVLLLLLKKS